jgi:predicted N-formylglutamate amidohydrolase
VDLGAAELTRELACELRTSAVLAGFTRLLVDANRDLSSATLFRETCDGEPVQLNAELTKRERARRLEDFYEPYHQAIDAECRRRPRRLLFSVHSFTPEYEGVRRTVEIGVLFDTWETAGHWLATRLAASLGQPVAMNEPWSGKNGLMYSCHSHADRHQAMALELEVRQDLLVQPDFRARLVPVLAQALEELVA